MRLFARLFAELDATTSTSAKVEALQRYFAEAEPRDAAWAVYFLAGGKPRQVAPMATMAGLACEEAGIAPWLFDECYQAVGDIAETIAHVLPRGSMVSTLGLADWVEQRLLPLRGLPPPEIAERVRGYWGELDAQGRFLLIKLVGGSFRVGVSRLLVQRALAAHGGIDAKLVAQRMMGYTDGKSTPSAERMLALIAAPGSEQAPNPADLGQPYPFFLAHQLDAPVTDFDARLGPVSDWQVEWKYDGIRGQVVKRGGAVWIWSRGEELVTDRYPEIVAMAQALPDGTVLDGEIMAWVVGAEQDGGDAAPSPAGGGLGWGSAAPESLQAASAAPLPTSPQWGEGPSSYGRPAPFALLQQRIGRKTVTKKILADVPVTFMAYDLLEQDGQDIRPLPQRERRARLAALLEGRPFKLSPVEHASTWDELAERRAHSRAMGVEGFMLKRLDAAYGTGRTKADGLWWKWKIDPMSIDCVLVYAQAGHGRRASVYTDYTFAVWNRPPASREEAEAVVEAIVRREPADPDRLQLVAFAKAYSGLTDEEFRSVDALIRRHTIEKFGPVRSVRPTLVFELGFEGINRSSRHKSGIAVRFPRMLRIRSDKPLHEANTLQDLEALLLVR